jgi:uncharacterized protein YjeT (DUF2065 family)
VSPQESCLRQNSRRFFCRYRCRPITLCVSTLCLPCRTAKFGARLAEWRRVVGEWNRDSCTARQFVRKYTPTVSWAAGRRRRRVHVGAVLALALACSASGRVSSRMAKRTALAYKYVSALCMKLARMPHNHELRRPGACACVVGHATCLMMERQTAQTSIRAQADRRQASEQRDRAWRLAGGALCVLCLCIYRQTLDSFSWSGRPLTCTPLCPPLRRPTCPRWWTSCMSTQVH